MKDRRITAHLVTRVPRFARAVALVGVLLALSLGVAAAGPLTARAAAATSYVATIKDGRAAAKALLKQSGAASLSLALVADGRVVWSQGFGYADKTTSTPPQAGTMYGIGSVSKMLATVAAMKLVDQGKLELDAPVTRYLPGFTMQSPAYRQITVRMLLDHSSGFPGSTYGDALTGAYYSGYLQQVMDALAVSRLKTTPGYMSVYCNDGFTLVELLVPAVTGKTFPRYVQDEILAPLGMNHSAYPLEAFADGSYAKAYEGDTARPREVLNVLASGGLYSTPTDMSRLAGMLMNGGAYKGTRILSAAAVAEMGTDQTLRSFNPVPSNAARYGLGWDTVTQPGLRAVKVTGWMKGGDSTDYHAGFLVVPQGRLAVTVTGVTPLSSTSCEALGERILLHALVDQGTLRRLPKPIPAAAPPVKRATSAQLAAMTGVWALNEAVFRISASASDPQSLTIWRLAQDGWAQVAEGMRLRTDGRFHIDGRANSMYTITAGGRRYLVNRTIGGDGHYLDSRLLAQKLRPEEPLSAAWQSRVGRLWLAVNEQPDSSAYTEDAGSLLMVGDTPGLTGHVTITTPSYGTQVVDSGESDSLGSMFLQIPGFGSRDLEDAVIERRGNEDWIWWGSTLYRPQDAVPELATGHNTVTFGAEGYAEWRVLKNVANVQIGAGTAWRLYDADMGVLDSGTTFPASASAPTAGCHLLLFGPAGASTTVSVTPVGGAAAAAQASPAAADPPAFARLKAGRVLATEAAEVAR